MEKKDFSVEPGLLKDKDIVAIPVPGKPLRVSAKAYPRQEAPSGTQEASDSVVILALITGEDGEILDDFDAEVLIYYGNAKRVSYGVSRIDKQNAPYYLLTLIEDFGFFAGSQFFGLTITRVRKNPNPPFLEKNTGYALGEVITLPASPTPD